MLVLRSGGRVVPQTHGRCGAVTSRLGSMAIASARQSGPGRDRSARWLTAVLLAATDRRVGRGARLAVDAAACGPGTAARSTSPRRDARRRIASPSPPRPDRAPRPSAPTATRAPAPTDAHAAPPTADPHPDADALAHPRLADHRHHARHQRQVLRPGLRPRRRHEPVRRQGPRPAGPDRRADPRRVLQGRRRLSTISASRAGPRPASSPASGPPRPRRSSSTGRAARGASRHRPTVFPAGATLAAWRTTTTVDGTATTTWKAGSSARRHHGAPLGDASAASPSSARSSRRRYLQV